MSSKICSVDTCHSRVKSRNLCAGHYKAEQRKGTYDEPNRPTCKMVGCNSVVRFKEMCGRHYQIEQRANIKRALNECAVKPCPVDVYREGHCKTHYIERYPKTLTRVPDCRRPGCTEPVFRLEGCVRHWKIYQNNQLRRVIVPCSELGCQNKTHAGGRCKLHHKQLPRTIATCSEPNCESKTFALGRCQLHYNQFKNAENYPDDLWQFVQRELGIKA